MSLQLLSEHACFGGVQRLYQHDSAVIGLPMKFGIYLPPQARTEKVPVLFFHTGGHDDYHMPTDDPEKIDIPSAIGILDIHIQLIEKAMKRPKLVYTEVK